MNRFIPIVVAVVATLVCERAVAAEKPAANPDWSGVYVGFGLGGASTARTKLYPNLPQVGIPPTTFVSHGNDAIYNFHGGVQWQLGRVIVGAEVAYTSGFDGMKSSKSVSPPEPFTHLASTTDVTRPPDGRSADRLCMGPADDVRHRWLRSRAPQRLLLVRQLRATGTAGARRMQRDLWPGQKL